MEFTVKTKYEPYQHLWMLYNGVITEVVPTRLCYKGDKGGIKKEYWENDNTHCVYKVGDCWVDERDLFPTKYKLLLSLSSNAKAIGSK